MLICAQCPKITVLGEAAGPDRLDQFLFETQVRRTLTNIARMRVGTVLLDEINGTPHKVTVIPWPDTRPLNATSSATAGVVDTGESPVAALAARTLKNRPVMVADNSRLGVCKDKPLRVGGKVVRGTGTGDDEIVEFTPSQWTGPADRLTPETVLVHELTHSLRAKMGVMQRKFSCNAYDGQEEFFAILVENLFRSECKKNGQPLLLRWHHHSHAEMPPKLANPKFFFQFHKQRIWQFMKEMTRFTSRLMDLRDLEFNPLASKNQLAG